MKRLSPESNILNTPFFSERHDERAFCHECEYCGEELNTIHQPAVSWSVGESRKHAHTRCQNQFEREMALFAEEGPEVFEVVERKPLASETREPQKVEVA